MDTKQDSNNAGLNIAEESALKTVAANTKFYAQEPNSFADFGSDPKRTTRRPIAADRQRIKGTITDYDVTAGFNADLTQSNLSRLMQGFFRANMSQKPSTAPLIGTQIPVTAVNGVGSFSVTGANTLFKVNDVVRTQGFTQFNNNGVGLVTSVSGTQVTLTMDSGSGTFIEASPPSTARISVVGWQFASGAISLGGGAGTVSTLTRNSTTDATHGWDTLNLNVGEWIVVGSDLAAQKFNSVAVGYARIKEITSSTVLTLDKLTWTPGNDNGNGSTLRIYAGNFIRNATSGTGIVKRTYTLERTLSNDDNGVQSELIQGATPNELTVHSPQGDKVNVDMSFIGLSHTTRTGAQGPLSTVNGASVVTSPGEAPFNTADDLFHAEVSFINPAQPYDTPIVANLTQLNIAMKNNVSATKALGYVGSFNTTDGVFEVSGDAEAYFTNVGALSYTLNNADISINAIYATNNGAQVWDLPLCSVTGDKINVEQDKAMMLPLSFEASRCKNLYTASLTIFSYVPGLAQN